MTKVVDLQKLAVKTGVLVGGFLWNLENSRQVLQTGQGEHVRESGWGRDVHWWDMSSNRLSLCGAACAFCFQCGPVEGKFDASPIFCDLAAVGHMDLQLNSPKNRLCHPLQVAVVLTGFVLFSLLSADLQAVDSDADVFAAVDAISRLQQLSPIFTDPNRRRGMSLQQRKAAEIEASKQLQRVPLELLIPQIVKYSVASERQVRSFDNPRAFVTRLSEVAMNGIITPPNPEVPTHGVVAFKARASHAANTRVFRGPTGKIFAVFDSAAYDDTRVLVKWYQPSSGSILLFKQFDIASGDSNYIWIDNSKGYAAGEYRVEIYRMNESVQLLSSGIYRLET